MCGGRGCVCRRILGAVRRASEKVKGKRAVGSSEVGATASSLFGVGRPTVGQAQPHCVHGIAKTKSVEIKLYALYAAINIQRVAAVKKWRS